MSITLIAKDDVPIDEIGQRLTSQGVPGVSYAKMNEILYEGKTVNQTDLVILISATQNTDDASDGIEHIRHRLSPAQRLVLCMPYTTFSELLIQQGADEIIQPAGQSVDRIFERILGYLIQEKRVEQYAYQGMRGATWQMRKIYGDIEKYARVNRSVLILGETGTGKSLVAQALHNLAGRSGKLVHIDCPAIGPEVIESELFGHMIGAFTGAVKDRMGLIETAKKGTAFVDEIGDLAEHLQAKLLDAVENNRVRPMGGNDYKKVDTRFVFATNRDLPERMREGKFREDLYARINTLVIKMPPLRKRLADIPLLADHFIERYNHDNNSSVKLQPGAIDELFRYHWPHNVRELKNVVDSAAAKAGETGNITNVILQEIIRDLREIWQGHTKATGQENSIRIDPQTDTWPALEARAKETYFKALVEVAENMKHASELSGIHRSHLHEILKGYNLKLRR
ncbi:MAG TPA: sigma 54-interacting transcriptional regulator [Pyrinomonadaceae bacterium]|jgi:transcriptional regulator with GAF, ATPase, and Fis domain